MKVLLSYNDRLRKDSTAVYFKTAFENIIGKGNVLHVFPEQLFTDSYIADLYFKIDDGQEQNRWNPKLHPSAYYLIDTHIDLEWRQQLAAEGNFDYLFMAQRSGTLESWHTPNKLWVPLGCDPFQHDVGKKDKKYDVCFMGNFHSKYGKERIEYLERLFKEFPNFYFSNARFFKEYTERLAWSRIVFNISMNKDVNMRFFEGMCSGSLLLSNVLEDQETLGFLDGIHYAGYKSMDEMVEKVKYYLENPIRRELVASTGQVLVKTKHTYEHRVYKMLDSLGRLESPKEYLSVF